MPYLFGSTFKCPTYLDRIYVNALLIWIQICKCSTYLDQNMLMHYIFGSEYVNALLIWIQICKCPTYYDPNIYECSTYLDPNM